MGEGRVAVDEVGGDGLGAEGCWVVHGGMAGQVLRDIDARNGQWKSEGGVRSSWWSNGQLWERADVSLRRATAQAHG